MDARARRELPVRLEGVRRRFERWRETREAHTRIPDSLWSAAARAAGRYGLSKTAHALRVSYYALKKQLAAKTAADRRVAGKCIGRGIAAAEGGREAEGASPFVELPPFASAGGCECLLEWEDAGGAKMRVRLRGVGTPDLAALGRSFWDRIASHDTDHAPDAGAGGRRAGRFPQRDRRSGPALQGRAPARSAERLGVRVSQPAGDGTEGVGLRRPGLLALSQAIVERAVPVVAGEQDRDGQDAGGPSVARSLLGG